MIALLALGACCGLPLLVGAFMFLTGKKKKKEERLEEAESYLIEQER